MILLNDESKNDKELQRIYHDIKIPSSRPSWEKVKIALEKKNLRNRRLRFLKFSSAIVISTIIFNIFVFFTTPYAYSQISTFFVKMQNDVIELFHERTPDDNSGAKTSVPDDHGDHVEIGKVLEVTLEDAIEYVSFELMTPSYLPDKFQLRTVRIFESSDNDFNNTQIEYTNNDGEIINIIQRAIPGKTDGLKAQIAIESGEYKNVYVNGHSAILMLPFEGNANLEWVTDSRVLIRISGKLNELEIMKLANSLK